MRLLLSVKVGRLKINSTTTSSRAACKGSLLKLYFYPSAGRQKKKSQRVAAHEAITLRRARIKKEDTGGNQKQGREATQISTLRKMGLTDVPYGMYITPASKPTASSPSQNMLTEHPNALCSTQFSLGVAALTNNSRRKPLLQCVHVYLRKINKPRQTKL